jgi:NADPH:quinone reductase-like Zn-dependent oxidoreductase
LGLEHLGVFMTMHAAVVRSFDRPPRYELFDTPVPGGPTEALVEVLAAGLHPRVRTEASGRHYTSTGALPLIPGIDGVGRLSDGQNVYFVTPDGRWGSMAERALIDVQRVVPLPESADPLKVAAAMNPAMSSWVALRHRVTLHPGQAVLVLGATGNAGTMAIQVAKRLGAGRVVGAGRNPERLLQLPAVGADAVVDLTGEPADVSRRLAAAAAEVDVVIDYLWGAPAAAAMQALVKDRADRSRALDWIQIGAMAGPTIELPSVILRGANLRIQGVGQGAVSPEGYLAELPALVEEIATEAITVNVHRVPLANVEAAWPSLDPGAARTVLVP